MFIDVSIVKFYIYLIYIWKHWILWKYPFYYFFKVNIILELDVSYN